jgi:hypothetical protein
MVLDQTMPGRLAAGFTVVMLIVAVRSFASRQL